MFPLKKGSISSSSTRQPYLEVGEELLRLAVMLSFHDDIGQLVNDDVEGSLGEQRLSEVNLTEVKLFYIPCSESAKLQYHNTFHVVISVFGNVCK